MRHTITSAIDAVSPWNELEEEAYFVADWNLHGRHRSEDGIVINFHQ